MIRTLITAAIVLTLLTSCKEDVELNSVVHPTTELSFTYKKVNAGDDSVYKVHTDKVHLRNSKWSYWNDEYWLIREIFFKVEPAKGEPFEVSLYLRKNEANGSLLLLEDEALNSWERRWNYKSFENESTNFYENFSDGRFHIDYQTFFSPGPSDLMQVVKTQKVIVDGVEKTYVEMTFQGEAFGVYDPQKEFPGYIIQEGIFKGFIE